MKRTDTLFALLSAALVLCTAPPLTGVAESILVGHWGLDDPVADAVVRDSSSDALHGKLAVAEKARVVPGHTGMALDLAGAAYVDLGAYADMLSNLDDFTLSLWFQYRPGGSRLLFSWSDGTLSRRVQVELHQDRLHCGWQNGGGWQAFGTQPLKWEPGKWYHVVFVNDRVTG